jgi:ribosomal protein L3 glutamine methyltransferase
VDPRVISPRSFLAELILGGFSPWIEDPTRVRNILDLCTGSGCLAILAAKTFPSAQVTATDLSPEALEVARSNVADYGLGDRIRLLESDLFDRLSPAQDIDLILSNPPYVPSQRKKDLPKEFLREPEMALLAKDNGMALVRQILRHAGAFLSPNGLLAVEIGHEFQSCSRLIHAECPGLEPIWIETDEQRDNVFVIDAPSLNLHSWRPLK